MAKRYRFLYGRLRQLGLTQSDVAELLGVQQASVSHRFTGRNPWSIDEMYKLLDLCQADAAELHIYFPRDGKDVLDVKPVPVDSRTVYFPRYEREARA